MSDESQPDARSEAADLIRQAFDRARLSGKPDWQQMTTAVLNNRLLQITDGTFSVARYGARTVVEFAHMFPELLHVNEHPTRGPAVLTLVDVDEGHTASAAPSQSAELAARTQVREDLWRAVMDWNPNHSYILDPVTGRARRKLPEDGEGLEQLETVSKEVYLQWRRDFIEGMLAATTNPEEESALVQWRDHPGPSRNLPSHLQDKWMDLLRDRVAMHVAQWFENRGLPTPSDLTHPKGSGRPAPTASSVEAAVSAQRLRDLVRRCVDNMSHEELRSLHLPADVVARVFGR